MLSVLLVMTEQTFIETQVKWKWNMAIAIKLSTLAGHQKVIGNIIPLSLWSGIIAKTRNCVLTGLPGGMMLCVLYQSSNSFFQKVRHASPSQLHQR